MEEYLLRMVIIYAYFLIFLQYNKILCFTWAVSGAPGSCLLLCTEHLLAWCSPEIPVTRSPSGRESKATSRETLARPEQVRQ